MLWKVELHSHTVYSKDCLTRLEDIPAVVQQRGLDKLAITDHNTTEAALQLARIYPMWVIPGVEVMTTKGELLGWYIRDEVPAGLSPMETIQILREQGALIGVSHPFDRYRGGAWKLPDLMEIIEHVDALEVYNARCLHQVDNDKALTFAQEHKKLMTAGSDAHTHREYGRATIQVRPFNNNAEGLRGALLDAQIEGRLSLPDVHVSSTFAKWAKRFVPTLSR